MKQKLAVITGADGGMGMEITRAVATAGYKVIMACRDPEIAEEKRQLIMRETGNIALEIVPVNLASLSSTASFANELLQRGEVITLLMNMPWNKVSLMPVLPPTWRASCPAVSLCPLLLLPGR